MSLLAPQSKVKAYLADARQKTDDDNGSMYYLPQGPGGSDVAKTGGSHPEKNNQKGGVVAASFIPAAVSTQLQKPAVQYGLGFLALLVIAYLIYNRK